MTGIESTGNMVKQPAKFTVDTISAGQGDVMVFVEDPEGNKEEVRRRCHLRLESLDRSVTASSDPHITQPRTSRLAVAKAVRLRAMPERSSQ